VLLYQHAATRWH